MNIELHIERVQSILDQMDLQKKCKFAAWCCNALIIEKKINENMTKITNSNVNYQLCDAIIKAGWYDFSQINIGISQKAIEDIYGRNTRNYRIISFDSKYVTRYTTKII